MNTLDSLAIKTLLNASGSALAGLNLNEVSEGQGFCGRIDVVLLVERRENNVESHTLHTTS